MSSGPLRQAVAAVGLLGLLPTAWMLVTGAVTPQQAAIRAVATLLAVLLVGRVAAWWLDSIASGLERHADDAGGDEPRRRRTDGPVQAARGVRRAPDAGPRTTADEGTRRTGQHSAEASGGAAGQEATSTA